MFRGAGQVAKKMVAAVGKEAAEALQAQVEAEWRSFKALRRRFSGQQARR